MGKYSLEKSPGTEAVTEMPGKYKGKVEPDDDSSTKSDASGKDAKPNMVGVFEVFRFSTGRERLLMLLGTVCACAHGSAMPLMMIVFGDFTDLFILQEKSKKLLDELVYNLTTNYPRFENLTSDKILDNLDELIDGLKNSNNSNLTWFGEQLEDSIYSDFMSETQKFSLYYTYIGCAVLLVGYLQMMSWRMACYGQSERIRTNLLRAILRQDISWFDTHEVGELGSRLVDDVDLIEKGIGDKIALFFQYVAAFFAGYIVGFVYGWELTLVILAVSPLLAIAGGFMAKLMSSMTKKELEAYAKAGAVAEEVLGSIRTVAAFGGEKKEVKRYTSNLKAAQALGLKKGVINGVGMGAVFFLIFGSYALAFWYGSSLIREGEYTPGTMLIVFFSVLMGAFSIGAASPNVQDFANARGAAYTVYNIIDLIPPIDSSSTEGETPDQLIGNIEFKNIVFRYPSRPEIQILNGLNLRINSGQTVALVGSSGCGKSTCIQLLQRFYDPLEGTVTIDGRDLKDFNLKWLRQHIGVVSQEPILFGTTIAENIRYGRDGVTMEELEKATKEANAYDFIMKLPDTFETLVGERGAQLSGGQKQRIAIARALVRDPVILLLDEATSALDTESEGIVQAALDKAREGRTTIVVAHRLSTIQTADIIAGVCDGVIVEQGTHDELMGVNGVYYTLVTNQMHMKGAEDDKENEMKKTGRKHVMERGMSVSSAKKDMSRSVSTVEKPDDRDVKAVMKEEKLSDPSIKRVMRLNSPEWPYILMGCISATVMGLIQPMFAIIFSSILGVFTEEDLKVQEEQCNFYSGMFAVLGVIAGLANFGEFWMFSRSGEYLTTRLRKMAFSTLLKQEIGYFDDHANGTGALCSRLSTDAAAVKGATGSRLATVLQSFASIGAGVVIGFIYSWKLTLVVLAFAPFMMLGGFIDMQVFQGGNKDKNKKMEEAAKVANEGIENIRTVANLTREETFHEKYCRLVGKPYGSLKKKSHLLGMAYAYSQAIVFFANAGGFAFGAWLVRYDGLDFESMFKVFTAIVFGAMAAGQATSFAPDYSKAKLSSARMFALFDRVPAIDSSSKEGEKPDSVSGSVDLKDIYFTYPTRPDVPVLKGVNVSVQPGQMVALVGSSGCGKSTIVQLLERFYDPASGNVILDGHETQSLNIQWLRSQIGIVSQEPILFDCSIRENIAYGDNTREVSMDEIINAARQSNIHSFIETLPQGYETNVGDKGAQLSGGQKQRVAIARALIRNPKILLLDEATSALDTESEKVVQEALERAQEGRTSIVIAHRLSTIKNADRIVVIHNGLVAEVGTHNELMTAQGYYYRLNTKQARKRQETENANPPEYEELN